MPRQPKTKNSISTVNISEEVNNQAQNMLTQENIVSPLDQMQDPSDVDTHFANKILMTGLKQVLVV